MPVSRSRKSAWLRDELILALDLYQREGRNPSQDALQELSSLLRALPIEPQHAESPAFRNKSAVQLKVSNFVALDPAAEIAGMSRGGRGDREVWEELGGDPQRVHEAATAIRANIGALDAQQANIDEPEIEEAPEGALLTRIHRVRERNPKLVAARKAEVLAAEGKLRCEGCGFDFAAVYGPRGDGFIECHHVKPVSKLKPGEKTKRKDLALLCSNCHRMLHVKQPWLTVEALHALVVR